MMMRSGFLAKFVSLTLQDFEEIMLYYVCGALHGY